MLRHLLRAPAFWIAVAIVVLALAGGLLTRSSTPQAAPRPTATPSASSQPVVVVQVTATPAAVAAVPSATRADSPIAKLSRKEADGECRWTVYIYLSGFAPDNPITVDANYEEIECGTGKPLPAGHWQRMYPDRTDATGRLMISYDYEATGSYRYVLKDEQGNEATLSFVTTPEDGQAGNTPAAAKGSAGNPTPKPAAAATKPADPQVVVKSAALNLRSGPGTNYPIAGKATQGDKLYPVARVGNCDWLQVGAPGRPDLVWVAGGAQYVTLSVPCTTLMVQDRVPPPPTAAPTPTHPPAPKVAPTAVPRPSTRLLSRSGPTGPGVLRVKNGTDTDGVVILVTLAGTPVQAAYIRVGETYEMIDIADGAYRLYFTKGSGWNAQSQQFTTNVTRQRFADTLDFSGGNGWEVTLYGVAGGNAATQNVSPGDFPGLP